MSAEPITLSPAELRVLREWASRIDYEFGAGTAEHDAERELGCSVLAAEFMAALGFTADDPPRFL